MSKSVATGTTGAPAEGPDPEPPPESRTLQEQIQEAFSLFFGAAPRSPGGTASDSRIGQRAARPPAQRAAVSASVSAIRWRSAILARTWAKWSSVRRRTWPQVPPPAATIDPRGGGRLRPGHGPECGHRHAENDADRRVQAHLRVPRLRRDAAAAPGRLLHLRLLRQRHLPAHADRDERALLRLAMAAFAPSPHAPPKFTSSAKGPSRPASSRRR